MAQTFLLSTLLELEAALARVEAAGDGVAVAAVERSLSDVELLALERIPANAVEATDLLKLAARHATDQTRPPINDALRHADAGNFGVDLLVALRDVGAACVGDVEDPIFPQCIAMHCLRALTELRIV